MFKFLLGAGAGFIGGYMMSRAMEARSYGLPASTALLNPGVPVRTLAAAIAAVPGAAAAAARQLAPDSGAAHF